MVTSLVEFLLARIAEDERVTRDEVARREKWQRGLVAGFARGSVPALASLEWDDPGCPGDPARVLAECDAKRRIVRAAGQWAGAASEDYHDGLNAGLNAALRLLAVPYADHPDYDPAWRP
jgi:hypothetical protein